MQQLKDSGQIDDQRYKQLTAIFQNQQLSGNFQGIGSISSGSGRGLPGPLPLPIQQEAAQYVAPRKLEDSEGTVLGASDSGHGAQAQSQAAFLQHTVLAVQQKAQANAYNQQKSGKPLQTGAPRDFTAANNLKLQDLMQQQQEGRQLQQQAQIGAVVGGQGNANDKARNQARSSNHPAQPDSKPQLYSHGGFQRPTSGPVQGVSNHQQRFQNSMNAQYNTMAPPLQQVPVAPAQQSNTQIHVQSQIPPHLLPQYHARMAAMQKAAGQGGVVMSQPRSLAPLGLQVPTTADPGRPSAGGGSPFLITSSGLTSAGFSNAPNAIAKSGYLHPKHAGAHSSLGVLNSSLSSAKPSNLEAAGGEVSQRNSSGSIQQMHQLMQPHMLRPGLLSGGSGEGPVPGQLARHPSGFGFSRHQLTILRNQILAFKRLKARKGGDHVVSEEIKRLINPPVRPTHHSGQIGGTLRSNDHQGLGPPAMVNVSQPAAKVAYDSQTSVQENDVKLQLPVTREAQVFSAVERREGETQIGMVTSTSSPHPINDGDGQDANNVKQEGPVPSQLNREPSFLLEGTAKAQVTESRTTNGDPSIQIGSSSNMSVTNAKSEVPAVSTIQKSQQVVRPFRGPLFDFPPVSKRMDGAALSLTPQASSWGHPISLGYKVRELLLEEGLRVIDKKRAEKLKIIEDSLATDKRKKALQPDQVVKLRVEEKKLGLMELQARIRDEVEEQQQEIMAMGERAYRKFVRLCERQHMDLARQVMMLQRSTREKHLKALSQWRKKLLEAQWASRDARITRNRGVAKYHERMLREFSKKKDEDRNKRMEALKNNDVDAYREMLRQQQSQLPGDAGERFEVLSSFLTQTEEYLHKLGGKISAVKNHQEREEAALAAAAAARAQGYSEEEVEEAAVRAGEEVSINGYINKNSQDASVNKYYSLAHAVHEQILRQPSMLRVGTLRDYQLVGLQWMLSLYNNRLNGILADEMGLGKTVQVMALIAYLMEFKGNYGPHLIIVPNAVIVNWKSELLRWLPSVSCIYYVGHKDQRAKIFSQDVCAMKFNVLVTTYEFIMRDRSKLSKVEWKYMIIDEAQRMKDRESRLARDLDRFRCQRRLLLTGTPLQNDLHELWSLLNLLLPEVFDNSKSFHEWFAKPFQKETAQTTDEDDWLETEKKVIVIHRLHQILEPFMLRRRVEDVEGSLPPKISVVLKCKMSAYQAAIYDWVKVTGTIRLDPDDEAQRIAGNSKRLARAYAPLQNKCMELRKVCNHPYLNYPPRFHLLGDNTVRMCGKLWILDRILVKLHKSGHRVLLFSTMTRLLDILEDYLQWRRLSYRRIDGTTTLDARESAIVEFNRPGSESFIFLLSIRAAGRGLNLQTADTVVVYDPDPNPKNEEQAVARAHRIGQTREVRVIYLEAVVESVPSYEKEDELRSGGTLEEDDDEMAGKDRYVGSVESLVRNNIQQHKIDMADEVINAGRFDQRTTQEERRLTLEALLHDEERYQQTVHDVPTLQEVNRMIARTDEEVQLFDQMDEEYHWAGDLIPHLKVPKWLRVGSREVDAAVEATSKEAMKKGFVGAVGTREAEERLFGLGTSGVVLGKRSKSLSKYKKHGKVEAKDVPVYDLDDEEFEEEEREAVIEEALIAADADDEEEEEEEEEGEINAGIIEDEAMMDAEDGEEPAEGEEDIIEEVIEEVVEEEEEEEEAEEEDEEEGDEEEGEVSPVLESSYEGEVSLVKSHQVATTTQSKKFASLSALEARRTGPEESDDLEEGEIAASGDSEQQSESWMMEREEVAVEVEEEDQVIQPQKKRKRSNSHQRRTAQLDRLCERENSNGPFSERENLPILSLRLNSKAEQRPVPWSIFPGANAAAQMYDRPESWGVHAKKRHMNPPEVQASVRPRIVFKHSWANGSQEPAAEHNAGRGTRTAKLVHPSPTGNWGTAGGRLPESLQKKCKAVLGKLHGAVNKDGREIAELFLELPKRSELPDYYKVIARPINAHLIDERLNRFEYPSVLEFATDVHLMFDNAARFHRNIPEVQADARRLHALFEQRMGLMFPEVDFSSVRARSNMGAIPPKPPSVTGARGIRRPAPVGSESARQSQPETPNSRSSTRGTLVRNTPPQEDPVSGSTKVKGKKSKNPGKEKFKEKKSKSKNKSKVRTSVKDRKSVEEAEPDGGILHPVDLVIHKKKRKGREHTGSRTGRSHLGLDSEEPREASARSSTLGASGKSRISQGTPGWGQFAVPATGRRSGLQLDPKVGAVTVLKKSRTDGGKRRPSHT